MDHVVAVTTPLQKIQLFGGSWKTQLDFNNNKKYLKIRYPIAVKTLMEEAPTEKRSSARSAVGGASSSWRCFSKFPRLVSASSACRRRSRGSEFGRGKDGGPNKKTRGHTPPHPTQTKKKKREPPSLKKKKKKKMRAIKTGNAKTTTTKRERERICRRQQKKHRENNTAEDKQQRKAG